MYLPVDASCMAYMAIPVATDVRIPLTGGGSHVMLVSTYMPAKMGLCYLGFTT